MDHNHCDPNDRTTFNTKTKVAFGLTVLLYAVTFFIPALVPLQVSFEEYVRMIWWAVLLGFFLGGVIDYFVPDGFISSFLNKSRLSVVYAVFAGFILSACSHGILALSIQLYKKGASIPSVVAFLLATPWANLPVTILLFGFFGWQAFLFIGGAMLIAVITGLVFTVLSKANLVETNPNVPDNTEYEWDAIKNFDAKKAAKGVWSGTVSLTNMVLWWILIGVMASAVIGAYVPDELLQTYITSGFVGLLITLGVATIIEVCSEASSPIAFEIYKSVGALGNPFVFLMAGVVTDYTEIGLLWTNIGKKTAIWLPVITVPLVVACGYAFNVFL